MNDAIEQMSAFIRTVTYEDLPPRVVECAQRLLVDTVGCALGGHTAASASIARAVAEASSPSATAPAASVWVTATNSTPELAAFANGSAIRALDYNDYFHAGNNGGHPSDYIAPVVAAAEASGADGRTLLTAIVVAYELFGAWMDGFTAGGIVLDQVVAGVIASAGAVAYVRGLNEAALRNALGLSIVPNVALEATRFGEVSMWKGCAAANASRNGIFAADLAARGLTAPPGAFDGRGGFFDAQGTSFALALGVDGRYAIERAVLKRYPVGSLSQSAATAAAELRRHAIDVDEIASIELRTNHEAVRVMAGDPEKWAPSTRESADHSLPYVVAVTLVVGAPTVAILAARSHEDPRVIALMQRITVVEDAECEARYPEATVARIRLTTVNGDEFAEEAVFHRGHFRNPMSRGELEDKFRDQAVPVVGQAGSERLLDALWGIADAPDVAALVAATRPDVVPA